VSANVWRNNFDGHCAYINCATPTRAPSSPSRVSSLSTFIINLQKNFLLSLEMFSCNTHVKRSSQTRKKLYLFLLRSSAKVKNEWRFTSTPPYVFMVWCLKNLNLYSYRYFIALMSKVKSPSRCMKTSQVGDCLQFVEWYVSLPLADTAAFLQL